MYEQTKAPTVGNDRNPMSAIKRIAIVACTVMALLLVGCTPSASEPKPADTRAVSIERLCAQRALTEAQAGELLDLLAELGYEGEVLFSYPATDASGRGYDHIWIGEQTVDVYFLADGRVASVAQGGVVVYESDAAAPNEPTEPLPPQPEEPDESEDVGEPEAPVNLTLRVIELSEQVCAGDEAHLEVIGRPGEQYRIEVYYKSGISTAKGLEAQIAAEDGSLAWSWTVSARTTPGSYQIKLIRCSDERDFLELPFEVAPKAE